MIGKDWKGLERTGTELARIGTVWKGIGKELESNWNGIGKEFDRNWEGIGKEL
jgi:hypothetical protein